MFGTRDELQARRFACSPFVLSLLVELSFRPAQGALEKPHAFLVSRSRSTRWRWLVAVWSTFGARFEHVWCRFGAPHPGPMGSRCFCQGRNGIRVPGCRQMQLDTCSVQEKAPVCLCRFGQIVAQFLQGDICKVTFAWWHLQGGICKMPFARQAFARAFARQASSCPIHSRLSGMEGVATMKDDSTQDKDGRRQGSWTHACDVSRRHARDRAGWRAVSVFRACRRVSCRVRERFPPSPCRCGSTFSWARP